MSVPSACLIPPDTRFFDGSHGSTAGRFAETRMIELTSSRAHINLWTASSTQQSRGFLLAPREGRQSVERNIKLPFEWALLSQPQSPTHEDGHRSSFCKLRQPNSHSMASSEYSHRYSLGFRPENVVFVRFGPRRPRAVVPLLWHP